MSLSNQVNLIGHMGKDPEIKTTQSGKKIARLNIAVKDSYKNASGDRIENTQWINVVAWEGLATVCEKHIRKGKQIAVLGKLNTRKYTDESGETKYTTEVIATDILLIGNKVD